MSYIKSDFIYRLLDQTDIYSIVKLFVDLKKNGANYKGLSPFVDEKTPSFIVSPVKQIFKDFSSGKGGNVVTFIMELKNMTYVEAIEFIANNQGIAVEYEKPEVAEKKQATLSKKAELSKVLNSVHKLYTKELEKLSGDHPAMREIAKRGYSLELVKELELGYAPGNFLYDKFYNSGKIREAEALGLIREGQNNKYDLYTNRLIYPIRDAQGNVIGLAGRQLDNKKGNKWINPPVDDNNILYQKSTTWYGLHQAVQRARETKEIYIVEGYNDVIAFQENGVLNTVAPCGTAIAPSQIKILKRHVDKVILVLDPDEAGQRSMLKHIPMFLSEGIRTEVVILPGLDPDDFCRIHKRSIDYYTLDTLLKEPGVKKEGFLSLMESKLIGDSIERARGANELAKVIATIPDEIIRNHYTLWLTKESKETKKTIDSWIKQELEAINDSKPKEFQLKDQFEFPDNVVVTERIQKDAQYYNLFMANNQLYYGSGKHKDGVTYFSSISNFQIEYMMHIRDEKFPKKLIRVKNIFNEEMVFDTNSDNLNTLQTFYNTLTGHGNFRFDGNNNELRLLNKYLMDNMGSGIKIDVLGWQSEGFWVWNNMVMDEDGNQVEMTPNGIIVFKEQHYYVPSANKIYTGLRKKYKAQKQFKVIENKIPFNQYLTMVKRVHKEHAISAILFAFASLFTDHIEETLGSFPILFLYGPGGSGKDELAKIVQSFTGIPQEAINLEGGVSTAKASIREFAQFRNGISQLSEYRKGDQKLDGLLKGLWDRRGYKKGTIESDISTDTVEIESSVILTGNEYPTSDALISRLCANEMLKNEFTSEEGILFNELNDMTAQGVSGYSVEILKHRKRVLRLFTTQQREWKSTFQSMLPNTIGRIIANYSTLAAIYTVFKDTFNFPFTQEEMVESFTQSSARQMNKINAASITNKFFDLFIAALRGNKDDRLQVGQVVSMEGTVLFFNWRHTYAKLQRMWYIQFQEAAPSNTSLLSALEKANLIADKLTAHSFSPGKNGSRTSALCIDLNTIEETTRIDIIGSISAQTYEYQSKVMGQTSIPLTDDSDDDTDHFI
ncbi:DNA primase [Myroides odoratimimus]|uniref:DNA primase n=1 Tax=Myroides odoratimimus CIP 101113 TaxID=883154 RepID=A0AAV3F5K7_9FLAO|nr:DNA primase [Myroides odoratimimus]EHO13856.1 DNA primase [Myroides odoratimimus CIP 101113]